jgi:hypothetical protein
MRKRTRVLLLSLTAAASMELCAPPVRPTLPRDGSAVRLEQFWEEPNDLASTEMRYGPWGREHAPDPSAVYTLVRSKAHGASPGMTVVDSERRVWSVKQGGEGPVEVMQSRILSALGYHQPPVYFLKWFTLRDSKGTHQEPGGRFRPTISSLRDLGDWSWQQNPFVGTRPYQGLLILLLMFGGADLKNSNNSLYEHVRSDGTSERWYAARDIGNALGDTGRLDSSKNDPAAFERQPFIGGIRDGFVEFPYWGWHQELFRRRMTPEDLKWAIDLISRLTHAQWDEAFAAAGYDPLTATRFEVALKARIDQGRRFAEPRSPD